MDLPYQRGGCDPDHDGSQCQCAQQRERHRIAVALREPSAEHRAERGSNPLHGHHRTLAEIDAARAVEDAGDEARDRDALQSRADAIQNEVFEVGKTHGFTELRAWFQALYEVLLGQTTGPRMGSFIQLYGIDETKALIREKLAA